MIRACILPSSEFENFNLEHVPLCCNLFYELFEKLFGEGNCTYNLHIVMAHLIEIRAHGPLTMTSAFGFESFYGEVRHSFAPGTMSPLKQIFEKIMIKRMLAPHICTPSFTLTAHETSQECNNLIYTYERRSHNLFKITEIGENNVTCLKIKYKKKTFKETPACLEWDKVGVFELDCITDEIVILPQKKVCGKVVKINDLLITYPSNVLAEK